MKTRSVLVTGGNRGIGKAIAEGLSKIGGLTILLGCRDLEEGRRVAAGIDGDVTAVQLDVSERKTLQSHMKEIQKDYPLIDVLINNAGIFHKGEVLDAKGEDFDEVMRVNLIGPFDLIQLLAPVMINHGYGRIVNMSSGYGSMSDGLGGASQLFCFQSGLERTDPVCIANPPRLSEDQCHESGLGPDRHGWGECRALPGRRGRYSALAGYPTGRRADRRLFPRPPANRLVAPIRNDGHADSGLANMAWNA